MGSRVRVSSGPPTKGKRGFDIVETSFVFLLFHLQKIWLFASCSVRRPPDYRQSKSVYCELCQITERFRAKSPNFQIIAYFCRCEHFEIKYLYIQCYSADSLLAQIVLFISQKPFRLPFLRSIMPFFGKIDCNGLDSSFRFAYVCGDFFLCCFWSFLQEVQHCNLF